MKKPLFNTVAIVGVGLIGGSLGMAIKKRGIARWVIGITRRRETISLAFHRKAIDIGALDLTHVRDADLVILSAPVSVIADRMKELRRHLKRSAVIMDVGSSKELIQNAAKKHLKGFTFVGAHPMAGSECLGVENACQDLFEGATCFVTQKNPKVMELWRRVGSTPLVVSAADHDRWVSKASHLPHVLSFNLLQLIDTPAARKMGLKQINPSLREFARLAQSDPELWADIFISNKKYLAEGLDQFMANVIKWKQALKSSDRKKLQSFISAANQRSQKLGV